MILRAEEQLSPQAAAAEALGPTLRNRRAPRSEEPEDATKSSPHSWDQRKHVCSNETQGGHK